MNTNRKSTMIVLLLGFVLSLTSLAVVWIDRPVLETGAGVQDPARAVEIALDTYHAGEWGRAETGQLGAAGLAIYHASEWNSETFDRTAAAMEIYHASERGK